MYSVIIPTLLVPNSLYSLVEKMDSIPNIGEIIIINNSTKDINIDSKKTIILNQKENIYVNPSWNLGFSESNFENICICNDDISFDVLSVFRFLEEVDLSTIGLIGMEKRNYTDTTKKISLSNINKRDWGFGCLMFLKKDKYILIPDDIKIWCGDDYLFTRNDNNMVLCGIKIETTMSLTSDRVEFDAIKENDLELYKKL